MSSKHPDELRSGDCSNWLVWILFASVFLFVFIWIVGAFIPHHHIVIVEDFAPSMHHEGDPIVFKRKSDCKAGEVREDDTLICAPRFNVPQAYEPSITDVSTPMCTSPNGNMCGKWVSQHINMTDRTFMYARHRFRNDVKQILLANPDEPSGRFYQSCLDINSVGRKKEYEIEVKHKLESIVGDIRSYADIPLLFRRLANNGYASPLHIYERLSPLTGRLITQFATHDTLKGVTKALVTSIFDANRAITGQDVLHFADAVKRSFKVIEALNAHNGEPLEDLVDFDDYVASGGYNQDLLSVEELPPWEIYLDSKKKKNDQMIWVVCGRTYLNWLIKEAVPQMEINDWRAFGSFAILMMSQSRKRPSSSSSSLDCVHLTEETLPGLTSDLITRSAAPGALSRLQTIVYSLRDVLKEQLPHFVGKEKVDAMRIVFPSSDLEPFGPRIASDRFDHNMNLAISYRSSRSQWSIKRVTYNRYLNTLYLHPALLHHPYYQPDYDDVSLYATMGVMIGSEMARAFDSQGLHWSSGLTYTHDPLLNLTRGDSLWLRSVGLSLAFQASNQRAQVLRQRFFMIYSQWWCSTTSTDTKSMSYLTDPSLLLMTEYMSAFSCPYERGASSLWL